MKFNQPAKIIIIKYSQTNLHCYENYSLSRQQPEEDVSPNLLAFIEMNAKDQCEQDHRLFGPATHEVHKQKDVPFAFQHYRKAEREEKQRWNIVDITVTKKGRYTSNCSKHHRVVEIRRGFK